MLICNAGALGSGLGFMEGGRSKRQLRLIERMDGKEQEQDNWAFVT